MKSKINNTVLVALSISILVLASCSSNNGLTVNKRHYKKGFEVAWKSNKKANKQQQLNQQKSEDIALLHQNAINDNVVPVSAECNSDYKVEATIQPTVISKVNTPVKANSVNTIIETNTHTGYAKDVVATENGNSEKQNTLTSKLEKKKGFFKSLFRGGGGDMPKWAEIILCIILPPLPVALRFDIGKQFWISLVLTLLFWVPGVIYALIVCNQ